MGFGYKCVWERVTCTIYGNIAHIRRLSGGDLLSAHLVRIWEMDADALGINFCGMLSREKRMNIHSNTHFKVYKL